MQIRSSTLFRLAVVGFLSVKITKSASVTTIESVEKLKQYVTQQAGSLRLNIKFLWQALSSPLMRQQLAD